MIHVSDTSRTHHNFKICQEEYPTCIHRIGYKTLLSKFRLVAFIQEYWYTCGIKGFNHMIWPGRWLCCNAWFLLDHSVKAVDTIMSFWGVRHIDPVVWSNSFFARKHHESLPFYQNELFSYVDIFFATYVLCSLLAYFCWFVLFILHIDCFQIYIDYWLWIAIAILCFLCLIPLILSQLQVHAAVATGFDDMTLRVSFWG